MSDRPHTRLDSGLVLDPEGRWFHDGAPVEHPKIVEVFNRGIERAPDGRYLLRVADDWCWVEVQGTPLQVLSVRVDGEVTATYSNGRVEPLRPETLRLRDGVLVCCAASGMEARFGRAAQAALAGLLEEEDGRFVLVVAGRRWPIPE